MLNSPHPSAELARWAMCIQELDLVIKHKSGKHNTNSDALSRNSLSETAQEIIQTAECFTVPAELMNNPSSVTT